MRHHRQTDPVESLVLDIAERVSRVDGADGSLRADGFSPDVGSSLAGASSQAGGAPWAAIDGDFDWSKFVDLGNRLHYLPAMYRYLQDEGLFEIAPEPVTTLLERHFMLAQARYLKKLADLGEITDALERKGLRVVVLKGIALAQQLYSDPGVRVSKDIDLLFREDEVDAASGVLEALGYVRYMGTKTLEAYRESHYHYIFVRGEKLDSVVELHWNLLDPKKGHPMIDNRVRESLKTIRVNGGVVYTLDDAHALWHSCVHLSYERFLEFRNLADLKRLAGRLDEAQWHDAIECATRHSTHNEIATALSVAEIAFGVFVPEQVRRDVCPGAMIRRVVAATYSRRSVVWEWGPFNDTHRLVIFFLMRCGLRRKAGFLFRLLVPTEASLSEIWSMLARPRGVLPQLKFYAGCMWLFVKVLGMACSIGPLVSLGWLGPEQLDPARNVTLANVLAPNRDPADASRAPSGAGGVVRK